MKRLFIIQILVIAALVSCKEDKPSVRTSGTDTIDNTILPDGSSWYVNGFSFSQAKLISTNLASKPDITLLPNKNNTLSPLILDSDTFSSPFLKIGEYVTEEEAKTAFNDLKTVPEGEWIEMIDPLAENQVWIYRSNDEKYTKFRIVNIVNEMKDHVPYGECTFQWVHQPDGTAVFP